MNKIFLLSLVLLAGCSVIGHIDTIEPTDSIGWLETKPPSSFKVYFYKCENFQLTAYYMDIIEEFDAVGPPVLPIFPGPDADMKDSYVLQMKINKRKYENELTKESILLLLEDHSRIYPTSFSKNKNLGDRDYMIFYYDFKHDMSTVDQFTLIFNHNVGGCSIRPLNFIQKRHSGYLPIAGPHQ